MKPGVYDGIPNADYHAGEGVSNSGLGLVRKSPLHFRKKQLAANDNEPTVAQAIGTAFHALMLEPELFVQDYTLGIRQSDFPDAIDSRDQLVAMCEAINAEREAIAATAVSGTDALKAMIVELNKTRLPKLSTTGAKGEIVARILSAWDLPLDGPRAAELAEMKGAELKAFLDSENATRPGHLATSGSAADLAAALRAAGQVFHTRQELADEWQAMHGAPMFLNAKGTMQEMAEALRADGKPVVLWSELKAEWMANNGHRNVLEPEQWDQLHRMREAVMAYPAARNAMMGPGKAEQSVYWIDKATGELCRCRPDKWLDSRYIADLKTCDDASPEGFAKSIANWGYDVQDAFYTDGCAAAGHPIKGFFFVAVQKDACVVEGVAYGVAVYRLGEASREIGRAKYRADLATYAECKRTGKWPCYGDGRIQEIEVPAWSLSRNQHLLEQVS